VAAGVGGGGGLTCVFWMEGAFLEELQHCFGVEGAFLFALFSFSFAAGCLARAVMSGRGLSCGAAERPSPFAALGIGDLERTGGAKQPLIAWR
jgi:hypothetical protein